MELLPEMAEYLLAEDSAGISLEADLKHITSTSPVTWDAVWEVYLDPKWRRGDGLVYAAPWRAEQLVVFFGAASIGTGGGWGANAVLLACCKVVGKVRGTDQQRGREVQVDDLRTSRVSSALNGQQPCKEQLYRSKLSPTQQPAASEPGPSTPPPAKRSKRTKAEQADEPTQPTKGTGKAQGKAAKAEPSPQPGRVQQQQQPAEAQ
ncbi:hypothetical protein HaLaN_04729 [Haematococcus lacustris]|uniref:Uncharacterized protein n=1 Tax=Haematococcus lacustris TaxID=44745 RepID=A0A699YT78_HAELA|nr:hypothetical protein HaLaN_04729 [Haematococcus lacustris]